MLKFILNCCIIDERRDNALCITTNKKIDEEWEKNPKIEIVDNFPWEGQRPYTQAHEFIGDFLHEVIFCLHCKNILWIYQ